MLKVRGRRISVDHWINKSSIVISRSSYSIRRLWSVLLSVRLVIRPSFIPSAEQVRKPSEDELFMNLLLIGTDHISL